MSDILEATKTHIVRKIGDEDCKFGLLTVYDRADLLRDELEKRKAAHEKRRARFIDNLKLAEIKGEQMFSELEAFDDREPNIVTQQDWIIYVNDVLNEPKIAEKSLGKFHANAPELSKGARLTMEDKAAICGLTIENRPPLDEVDAENPTNPRTDKSYWTPGTNSTSDTPNPESSDIAESPTPSA